MYPLGSVLLSAYQLCKPMGLVTRGSPLRLDRIQKLSCLSSRNERAFGVLQVCTVRKHQSFRIGSCVRFDPKAEANWLRGQLRKWDEHPAPEVFRRANRPGSPKAVDTPVPAIEAGSRLLRCMPSAQSTNSRSRSPLGQSYVGDIANFRVADHPGLLPSAFNVLHRL
jgi:hypothetical protein